jgi:type IV secretion system protein VirD4
VSKRFVFGAAILAAGSVLWVTLSTWLAAEIIGLPGLGVRDVVSIVSTDAFAPFHHKVWIALAIPPGIGLVLAAAILTKPKPLHGAARFASASEAHRAGLGATDGVVLGRKGLGELVADTPGHVLAVAPTGAGKGVGWVIPTLLTVRGSVIVLDPKRENYELTAGYRGTLGTVGVFDPFTPGGSTCSWNPLGFVRASSQPLDEISRVANLLIPTPEGSDPHWTSSARSLFIGFAMHLNATSETEITIAQVLDFSLASGVPDDLRQLLDNQVITDPDARSLLGAHASRPWQEAGSVLSTLRSAIQPWELPSVRAATEQSSFDMRALRKRPQAIYVVVTPDNLVRARGLLALFWQGALESLTRRLPEPNEKTEVVLLMDEFTMPGPLPLIKNGLGFLRGYGIRVVIICQSLSQLSEVYGEHGSTAIIENCRFRAYMAPNDVRSAQRISDSLGSTTVSVRSDSVRKWGTDRSRSYSQQRRPLMLPQEIMTMGRGTVLIQVEGSITVKASAVRWYENLSYVRKRSVAIGGKAMAKVATVASIDPEIDSVFADLCDSWAGAGLGDSAALRDLAAQLRSEA